MALNEPLRADGAAVIPFPSKAAYYTQMAEEDARQVTGSSGQPSLPLRPGSTKMYVVKGEFEISPNTT